MLCRRSVVESVITLKIDVIVTLAEITLGSHLVSSVHGSESIVHIYFQVG